MKVRRSWYVNEVASKLAVTVSVEDRGTVTTRAWEVRLEREQMCDAERFHREARTLAERATAEPVAAPPGKVRTLLFRVARRADELAAEARNRAEDAAQQQAGVGGVNGPDYRMVYHWNGRAEAASELAVFLDNLLVEES